MKTCPALSVLLLWLRACSTTADEGDLIQQLPGLAVQPSFKQYSGYLQASDKKFLHYWFVESQRDPARDPLVLWLNGGPGCSSLDGLLTEHGPFLINPDGETLSYNQYSWNKNANVIYLESPAGVGFSYATDKNYTTDDDEVARHNQAALHDFMRKFPQYAKHDFYVTGESYAGVYIPTLLVLLVNDSMINLKGAAIGNGYLDSLGLQNSLYFYWYYHGVIGNVLWADMLQHCCQQGRCVFFPSPDPECQQAVAKATEAAMMIPLNPYNLIGECLNGGVSKAQRTKALYSYIAKYMSYSFTDSEAINRMSRLVFDVEGRITCENTTSSRDYLNRADVKKALHIHPGLPAWTVCSGEVSAHYRSLYIDMKEQLKTVLELKSYRILVYNGDMDMACNFLGDQLFVDNLQQKETVAHKEWYYKAKDGTRQIGGFVRQFENLTFLTVRGAGHMVPTDRPVSALRMFTNFLENKPF